MNYAHIYQLFWTHIVSATSLKYLVFLFYMSTQNTRFSLLHVRACCWWTVPLSSLLFGQYMYLLHVLPICHFPIFFVSPEFFPFYLNFLLSYLLFSPNITHHFYMYLCWCHIIPPPLSFPLTYIAVTFFVFFFYPFPVLLYIMSHYIPQLIFLPFLFYQWFDRTNHCWYCTRILLLVSEYVLFYLYPVIFALPYLFPPLLFFPLPIMLLCPTLFPPLLFSPYLCCYVPLFFPLCYFPFPYVAMSHTISPPLLFSRLPMLLFLLFFPTVIFPLPMLFCPTLFPPLLFSPYLWRWLYRTDHCWHYTGILLPGSMSHSVSI